MSKKITIVVWTGSRYEDAETWDTARERVRELARAQARQQGIGPDELREYEVDGPYEVDGAAVYGMCPDGDEGSYWPRATMVAS